MFITVSQTDRQIYYIHIYIVSTRHINQSIRIHVNWLWQQEKNDGLPSFFVYDLCLYYIHIRSSFATSTFWKIHGPSISVGFCVLSVLCGVIFNVFVRFGGDYDYWVIGSDAVPGGGLETKEQKSF